MYHANLQDMAKILNHLLKQDVENGNQGSLSREDLKGALAELFPHRDEESILMLCKAAELELELKSGDDVIYYKNLFMEVCDTVLIPYIMLCCFMEYPLMLCKAAKLELMLKTEK